MFQNNSRRAVRLGLILRTTVQFMRLHNIFQEVMKIRVGDPLDFDPAQTPQLGQQFFGQETARQEYGVVACALVVAPSNGTRLIRFIPVLASSTVICA